MNEEKRTHKFQENNHSVEFLYKGEIPFGPEYFEIAINNHLIVDRYFAENLIWNPDSNIVALQEWLTIDKMLEPKTALTLLDLKNNQSARISMAENGFIKPISFYNDKVIFQKDFSVNLAKIIEFEISLENIKNWENINYA